MLYCLHCPLTLFVNRIESVKQLFTTLFNTGIFHIPSCSWVSAPDFYILHMRSGHPPGDLHLFFFLDGLFSSHRALDRPDIGKMRGAQILIKGEVPTFFEILIILLVDTISVSDGKDIFAK